MTKARCYRDRDNGVYYQRNTHHPDCIDAGCRGCRPCTERHCTAKKNCTWHIDDAELTCGRCITAVRRDLAWIEALSALMLPAAINDGLNSEAANLAGPSADYATFSARRAILKRQIYDHLPETHWPRAFKALLPDDDEHHPYAVVTRWEAMIREDYGHEPPEGSRATVSGAIAYLDRTLHRIAHDDEQDFPLMASELKQCRQHLEAVLHNDDRPDRGAPCPACHEQGIEKPPRLQLHRGHWCDDEDCRKLHYSVRYDADAERMVPDTSGDLWVCPRDESHTWTEVAYRGWVEERAKARTA